MEYYVFDIDGVLVDPRRRLEIALSEAGIGPHELKADRWRKAREFWRAFLNPQLLALDEPRRTGISLLKDRASKGRILVVTGRPSRLRRDTILQLKDLGVYGLISALLMRRRGDYRPEWAVKPEILKRYVEDVYAVREIHDDNERTLRGYSKEFPGAKLYLHFDDEFEQFGGCL